MHLLSFIIVKISAVLPPIWQENGILKISISFPVSKAYIYTVQGHII